MCDTGEIRNVDYKSLRKYWVNQKRMMA